MHVFKYMYIYIYIYTYVYIYRSEDVPSASTFSKASLMLLPSTTFSSTCTLTFERRYPYPSVGDTISIYMFGC